jgi:hypothetical protein
VFGRAAVRGVIPVALGHMGAVPGLFMFTGLMVFSGGLVVFSRLFVVLRCFAMMLRGIFGHLELSF